MPDQDTGAPSNGPLIRLLVSSAAARVADEGARVSLVLVALAGTRSPAVAGTMLATLLVPHVVAAPAVGWVIDRSHRRFGLLALAVGGLAACLVTVAVLIGHAPLWVVYAVLLVGGCCGPAVTGGLTGQIPTLVAPDGTARAFGVDSMLYNIAGLLGPGLAGISAATAGPRTGQGVLACFAAAGAIGLLTIPAGARSSIGPTPPVGLLAGVRHMVRTPALRVVTLTSSLGQVGPGALPVVATLLASARGVAADGGLLLASVAAGSLVGSLLWIARPITKVPAVVVTSASMVGVGVPLGVAATSPPLLVTAGLFALSGVFVGPFASALFLVRTQSSPPSVRTQVFTTGAGLKVTAAALGAALVGFAGSWPVPVLLLVVAASPLSAGLLGLALVWRTQPASRPVVTTSRS